VRPRSARAVARVTVRVYVRACLADVLDKLVTPISAHRGVGGGDRPADHFCVVHDGIVDRLLGDDALVIHTATNSSAVKLVAPLDVYWRASRSADGARGPKVLVFKGHYAALVTDQSEEGGVIFHLDDDAFAYPPEDREEYKRAMARALTRMAARGAAVPQLYLSWAATVSGA
jgi:hypothetical protein